MTKYEKRSEETEQKNVISWRDINLERYPELYLLSHVPNGGSRNPREGKNLKQMGVRAGAPDLQLPVARGMYHGLFIEMKYNKNVLSPEQKMYLKMVKNEGYFCAVCYSANAATRAIETYLNLYDRKTLTLESIRMCGVEGKYDSNGLMTLY